jgi:hypothetical protein
MLRRHCEEPTGRANARPMINSATKQSILSLRGGMDCFASLAMTEVRMIGYEFFGHTSAIPPPNPREFS